MNLNVKKEMKIIVDYNDLEDFLKAVYRNKKIDVIGMEEWSNDQSHEFTVKKNQNNKYDMEDIEKVKSGEFVEYCLSSLLNDCCDNGLLEPGEYLIRVCW